MRAERAQARDVPDEGQGPEEYPDEEMEVGGAPMGREPAPDQGEMPPDPVVEWMAAMDDKLAKIDVHITDLIDVQYQNGEVLKSIAGSLALIAFELKKKNESRE